MQTRELKSGLAQSLSHAITFLCESQLASGEFRTYASSDETLKEYRFDSSPFVTALVLYSIGFCHDPRVQPITAQGLDWLTAEMESGGVWRYWSSHNEQHEFLPPDLDDTCCISFLLSSHGRPLPNNRPLILANRNDEGIFYTWLLPRVSMPAQARDALQRQVSPGLLALVSMGGFADHVDCAVNANVLLYLGESVETKRTIDYLIRAASLEMPTCSDYYIHRLSFYYLLSRAYLHGVRSLVRARTSVANQVIAAQSREGAWDDELLTALAVSTLLNLEVPSASLDGDVRYLLETQQADGSWRRIPMFLGPAPYYGSEELTTGLCVEALARYQTYLNRQERESP